MNGQKQAELKRMKGDNKYISILSASNLQDTHSNFQNFRKRWDPCLPLILRSPVKIKEISNFEDIKEIERVDVSTFFPLTYNNPLIKFEAISDGSKSWNKYPARRIGVVLSGGQAAGGHNVIAGIMSYIKLCNQSSQLFGFLGGPEGVYTERYIELSEENTDNILNQGGFNVICSGRHKIETEEQMKASMNTCEKLNLHGLVVIGGDDSNTNAAILAEYFKKNSCSTIVVGCPKTIDGDLKNDIIETSFGYDTAIKTYSEQIGSIMNCLLTEKDTYYFVRLMGRSASHITLECGLQTHCNLILIGEEIKKENRSLMSIVDEIVEMIVLRDSIGKKYGIVLLPEGLIEFIPEFETLIKELNLILLKLNDKEQVIENLSSEMRNLFLELPTNVQNQLLLERDPHGNVQVAKIATEELLVFMAKQKLLRIGKAHILDNVKTHYLGYEGRCALPSNFDANYCFALGHTAAVLIENKCSGYMAVIRKLSDNPRNWEPAGCPLTYMMNVELRKGKLVPVIKKYLVDLNGEVYKSYCKVRSEWKTKDYYRNPGPIQFEGPNSETITYMINPPKIEDLLNNKLSRDNCELSIIRNKEDIKVPKVLFSKTTQFYEDNEICSLNNQELSNIIAKTFPHQVNKHKSKVLLLSEEDIDSNKSCKYDSNISKEFSGECIGVILSNQATPGCQNIILGIISTLKNLKKLIIFKSINDFINGKALSIDISSEENISNLESFLNLGGLRLSNEIELKFEENLEKRTSTTIVKNSEHQISEICIKSCKSPINSAKLAKLVEFFNLNAMVLMGGSDMVTFGSELSEQLLCMSSNNITKEIPIAIIPLCIENTITHPMIDLCIGFDSITRNASALVGNLLTDSASATKYWYFMKLIGPKTSNVVLEVSLQTHPNIVVIPERYKHNYSKSSSYDIFNITLDDIITEICDIICLRSNQSKNFGGLIVSEGLLDQVYPTKECRSLILKLLSQDLIDYNSKLIDIEKITTLNAFEKKIIEDFKFIFSEIDEKIVTTLLYKTKIDEIPTEVIISSLVQKELKYRKTQNKFKGTFNAICFNFSDQVRSCFPTELDCNMSYMHGKIAGKIIQNNLIGGFLTGIKGILECIEEWKVYAIPITNLVTLDFQGKNESNITEDESTCKKEANSIQKIKSYFSSSGLICKLNNVDVQNNPSFQLLMDNIDQWELKSVYTNPGPIQFFGNFKNIVNRTLFENEYVYTRNLKEIKEMLMSIKHSCHYGVEKEILDTTFIHLRALQKSISILSKNSSKKDDYEKLNCLQRKNSNELEYCAINNKYEHIEFSKNNYILEERHN